MKARPVPPTRAWLTQVRATSEFQEAATAVDAHNRALISIGADNLAQAQLDLQPALATRYSMTPYILNLQARLFEAEGDLHAAEVTYSKAARFPAASPSPPFVSTDPYLEQICKASWTMSRCSFA